MEIRNQFTSNDIATIINNGRREKYGKYENFIQDGVVLIENSDISGPLQLDSYLLQGVTRTITFSNCAFDDQIYVYQYNHIQAYHFIGCVFEKSVSFNQVRTTINFSNNCQFKSELAIVGSGDTICNISDVCIDGLITITGGLANKFTLCNINLQYDNSEMKGRVSIKRAYFRQFEAKNVNLLSVLIQDKVTFSEDAVLRHLNVNELIIDMAEISGEFILSASDISILRVCNFKKSTRLVLNRNTFDQAVFDLSELNNTDISNCTFNYLKLYGTNNKESIFNIKVTEILNLEFYSIKNEGTLTLTAIDIPASGRLFMESSNLGKADFFNCKFSDAILEFENSKITEIFMVETDFPENVKLEGKFNPAQAQLAFGQLHTALQKQGDTVRSLEYQAREIEAHYKILKQKSYVLSVITRLFKKGKVPKELSDNKPSKNLLGNRFLLNYRIWSEAIILANIFSLWLNNLSNNFGRSWQRGVVFSFGIGALFFYFLVLGSKEFSFGFPIDLNSDLIRSYLKFMNPIRFFELENLFKDKSNPNNTYLTLDSTWCFVWDFLGRVFVAYGYYQTIQAFRRFGRK